MSEEKLCIDCDRTEAEHAGLPSGVCEGFRYYPPPRPVSDYIEILDRVEGRLKAAEELLREWSDELNMEDYGTTECEKERKQRTDRFLEKK